MLILLVIIFALLGGVVGAVLIPLIYIAVASMAGVSNFEGALAMGSVSLMPVGGLIGIVAGAFVAIHLHKSLSPATFRKLTFDLGLPDEPAATAEYGPWIKYTELKDIAEDNFSKATSDDGHRLRIRIEYR